MLQVFDTLNVINKCCIGLGALLVHSTVTNLDKISVTVVSDIFNWHFSVVIKLKVCVIAYFIGAVSHECHFIPWLLPCMCSREIIWCFLDDKYTDFLLNEILCMIVIVWPGLWSTTKHTRSDPDQLRFQKQAGWFLHTSLFPYQVCLAKNWRSPELNWIWAGFAQSGLGHL